MLDSPLYTPSPKKECLYKMFCPGKTGKTPEKTQSMLDWPLYTPSPTKNASIKWPVQLRPRKKHHLCWTGHFIPLSPTENASIKWTAQVKPLKKHNLCWTGHFIPRPVGWRTSPRKREDLQRGRRRRGPTGRPQRENETCHAYSFQCVVDG